MNEIQLAKNLKKQCFLNGREKNPGKSAHLIHKLGLIYAKKPGKISIIQSATLFNAALVRNPKNEEIKKDLSKFCRDLVSTALGCNTENVDLLEATQTVRLGVDKMRNNANDKLKELRSISEDITDPKEFEAFKLQKISAIQKIQIQIASDYKDVMKNLCDYCVSILGGAPCEFALIALGSLARNEITPYSDFENIIVLEEGIQNSPNYPKVLEFFRWYAVIFQVILINLGETIIPCVGIPCLNDTNTPTCEWFFDDYTPRGVSFDGMVPHACKSPLGRPFKTKKKDFEIELIKPVTLMAKYIDAEEDLKNGYHLADMLKTSCFVAGNEGICNEFQALIKLKLENVTRKHQKEIESSIKEQIKSNLQSFSVENSLEALKKKHSFNIKSLLYRSSTVFISAMGKLSSLEACSCFDIINDLPYPGLTNTDRLNLKFAVAVSCEARLKIYAKHNSQNDNLKVTSIDTEFVTVLGLKTLVEYFLIVSTMQKNIFTKHTDFEVLANQAPQILYHLQQYDYAIDAARSLLLVKKLSSLHHVIAQSYFQLENYDKSIEAIERALELGTKTKDRKYRNENTAAMFTNMGLCYFKLKKYEKAIAKFHRASRIRQSVSEDVSTDENLAELYYEMGHCNLSIPKYERAIACYKKTYAIIEKMKSLGKTWYKESDLLNDLGICYIRIHKYEESLEIGRLSLKLKRSSTLDEAFDKKISYSYNNIGLSLRHLGSFKEAAENYENNVEILKKISLDTSKDPEIAEGYLDLGICWAYHGNQAKAMESYKSSLAIRLGCPKSKYRLIKLNDLYYNLGICHRALKNIPLAKKYILKALQIRKKLTSNRFKDEKICCYYSSLGNCYYDIKEFKLAEILYTKSIQIREVLALENPTCIEGCLDRVAGCYEGVANCEHKQGFYHNALYYFNLSSKIRSGDTTNIYNDSLLSEIYMNMGKINKNLCRLRKAIFWHRISLKKIKMNKSFNKAQDEGFGCYCKNVASCYETLQKPKAAKKYYRYALKIYRNIKAKETTSNKLSIIFEKIQAFA